RSTLLVTDPTAAPGSYPLSLHDALPIYCAIRSAMARTDLPSAVILPASRQRTCWLRCRRRGRLWRTNPPGNGSARARVTVASLRSEEHTSELQSRENLVCRLLLEKKKIS